MVPNTSSSPLSWKPVPRDWRYLRQGTTYVPVLHTPSHLPATNSFPWHLTKSSHEVSVLVYHDAAPLFSPFTPLLISALFPLQEPSGPGPHLSPPTAGPLPFPAASYTASCPLRPWGLGREVAGERDHACSLSPPSLLLTLVWTMSQSWHKPTRRCPPQKRLAFSFVQSLYPFVSPRLSHSASAHT